MKIVVALGGNALGNTPGEQLEIVEKASKTIANLIEAGHELVITHGNGPQVGMIFNSFYIANNVTGEVPEMPFPEAIAMSQGYIGYHLQNKIGEELINRNIYKAVVTIVTQVVVDKEDPGFDKKTKPIGPFYTEEEVERLREITPHEYKEDSGRGYRRVVASPKPLYVVESDVIEKLTRENTLVIASGGGGIPVYQDGNKLVGIDAVVDKDYASAKLAEDIGADLLVIFTAVDKVAINFGKDDEKALDELSLDQIETYIDSGEFAEGSMLPKIKAAREFVAAKDGNKAIIACLDHEKLNHESILDIGTLIKK